VAFAAVDVVACTEVAFVVVPFVAEAEIAVVVTVPRELRVPWEWEPTP